MYFYILVSSNNWLRSCEIPTSFSGSPRPTGHGLKCISQHLRLHLESLLWFAEGVVWYNDCRVPQTELATEQWVNHAGKVDIFGRYNPHPLAQTLRWRHAFTCQKTFARRVAKEPLNPAPSRIQQLWLCWHVSITHEQALEHVLLVPQPKKKISPTGSVSRREICCFCFSSVRARQTGFVVCVPHGRVWQYHTSTQALNMVSIGKRLP